MVSKPIVREESLREAKVGSHHKIGLIIREETEGHGVLFRDDEAGRRDSWAAMNLIPRYIMKEREGQTFKTRVHQILNESLEEIAEALSQSDFKLEDLKQEQEEAQPPPDCTKDLLRFVSWLGQKHEVWPKEATTNKREMQDLINDYLEDDSLTVEDGAADTALVALALANFARWLEESHSLQAPQHGYQRESERYIRTQGIPGIQLFEVTNTSSCPFVDQLEGAKRPCMLLTVTRPKNKNCVGIDHKDCPITKSNVLIAKKEKSEKQEPTF